MKIGMKYCGGCRPPKKNPEVFGSLLKYLMDQGAVTAYGRNEYDYLFLLSGCPSGCASTEGCLYRKKVFKVDRDITEEAFIKIKEELERGED